MLNIMPTTTTTTVAGRTKHAKAILGDELHKKLGETKVLVVGAGGIGCELSKRERERKSTNLLTRLC